MKYLDLVNSVLRRLRESTVSVVDENSYSALIGEFVNDAKRYCEDAWDWSALRDTFTAETESGVFSYTLVNSGQRIKVFRVIDDTNNRFLTYQTANWMSNAFLNQNAPTGEPAYYSFNGVNDNGDTQVDIYPIPGSAYTIRFEAVKRTERFTDGNTELKIPDDPVIQWAYAYALRERGETGGQSAAEQVLFAQQALSDAIALDAQKHPEETVWNTI
jgi:hypothetical protein